MINVLDSNLKSYNEAKIDIIIKLLNSLSTLMDMNPDLLDVKGVEIIKRYVDKFLICFLNVKLA